MSHFNRKGYTTVTAKGQRGSVQHIAVPVKGKLARIAKHKRKQMERVQKQAFRDYKEKLRDAKKQLPLAERSKVKVADL